VLLLILFHTFYFGTRTAKPGTVSPRNQVEEHFPIYVSGELGRFLIYYLKNKTTGDMKEPAAVIYNLPLPQ
jgi:hypothetical protein